MGRSDITNNFQVGARAALGFQFGKYFGVEGGYAEYARKNNTFDLLGRGRYPLPHSNFLALANLGVAYVDLPGASSAVVSYGAGLGYSLSSDAELDGSWYRLSSGKETPSINFFNFGTD